MHVLIEPFTERQAGLAREAYQRFGRGSGHAARLNMGDCSRMHWPETSVRDCCSKGRDFALTDIEMVTTPNRQHRLSEVVGSYVARN
ncbi:hypothetical protein BH20CHL7_BH20CHL7_02890 [soil metagenome]